MPQQDLIRLILSTAGVENALVEGALVLVLLRARVKGNLRTNTRQQCY